MIDKIISIIKMDFLTKNDSYKNWRMILFISVLTLVMISSGHSSDNKIFRIADLNEEIRALKSEFISQRSELMMIKMESNVINKLSKRGLNRSNIQATKIIVKQ